MSDELPQPDPGLETGETGTDVSTQALTQALRGGFVILYIVIFILAGYFFSSNFSRVEPGQRSVVLRFGRPLQTTKDDVMTEGKMIFAWPYPIDEKVDISGGYSTVFSTVGWYGGATGANPEFNPERDGYVLTRDWNILHIKAELHYVVEDPIRYNFEYFDVEKVLQLALNNAIVLAASAYNAEDILNRLKRPFRTGFGDEKGEPASMIFQDALNLHLRHLVSSYDLGVAVNGVTFQSDPVLPRGKVTTRNKELFQKRIDSRKRFNQALESALATRKSAAAGALDIANIAKAESDQLADSVKNEFAEFNSLWKNFKDDPENLQLELEKRLRDTIRGIMADPNVEITKLPAGPNGARPKVKLIVRRLPPPPPEAMQMEGPGGDPTGGGATKTGP